MDSDLAWVNGKSGRQSWRYADCWRFPALYNIWSHLPFFKEIDWEGHLWSDLVGHWQLVEHLLTWLSVWLVRWKWHIVSDVVWSSGVEWVGDAITAGRGGGWRATQCRVRQQAVWSAAEDAWRDGGTASQEPRRHRGVLREKGLHRLPHSHAASLWGRAFEYNVLSIGHLRSVVLIEWLCDTVKVVTNMEWFLWTWKPRVGLWAL